MKLTEQPTEIQEALGAFEGLRRLGYLPDQIRVGVHDNQLIVQFHWRGLAYNMKMMDTKLTDDEFQSQWAEFAEKILPKLAEKELQDNWYGSMMLRNSRIILPLSLGWRKSLNGLPNNSWIE